MEKIAILVTGATGQQGGLVARRLLARGHAVRALTRNPGSPEALALAELGAEVVRGNLEDPASLAPAMAGLDAVFLVSTPFEKGAAVEIVQAVNAGRAAKRASVAHLVYSSVIGARQKSGIEHFEAKGEAELALEALGVPLTIIGAPPFMDNVLAHWNRDALRQGRFALVVPRSFPMQQVAVADIAAFAVHALEHRSQFIGQRIDIASDAISGEAMHRVLQHVLGRELEYVETSFADIDPMLGKLFAGAGKRTGAGDDAGSGAGDPPAPPPRMAPPPAIDLPALHARYPEISWHSFESWARAQDFSEVLS